MRIGGPPLSDLDRTVLHLLTRHNPVSSAVTAAVTAAVAVAFLRFSFQLTRDFAAAASPRSQ